ncbi:MAG TPA: hypothetical protein VI076_04790 [Actinopolymorphaceae bacterium]
MIEPLEQHRTGRVVVPQEPGRALTVPGSQRLRLTDRLLVHGLQFQDSGRRVAAAHGDDEGHRPVFHWPVDAELPPGDEIGGQVGETSVQASPAEPKYMRCVATKASGTSMSRRGSVPTNITDLSGRYPIRGAASSLRSPSRTPPQVTDPGRERLGRLVSQVTA